MIWRASLFVAAFAVVGAVSFYGIYQGLVESGQASQRAHGVKECACMRARLNTFTHGPTNGHRKRSRVLPLRNLRVNHR
eukprot:6066566-Pleurochrysis_carterae.AAC.1